MSKRMYGVFYLKKRIMSKGIYFDIDVATEYSVEVAIIGSQLSFWIKKNMANEVNHYDGNYWTYNSIRAWSELLPFYSSKQVRRILSKMTDKGLILTGNYNKSSYDQTRWYAFTEKGTSIFLNGQIEKTKWANQNAQEGKPIPVNNTVNNTLNNTVSKSVTFQPEVETLFLEVVNFFPERCQPTTVKAKQDWKEELRKLIEIDKVDAPTILHVVKIIREDEFWSGNFLSILKLRKKDKQGIKYIDKFIETCKQKMKNDNSFEARMRRAKQNAEETKRLLRQREEQKQDDNGTNY